MKKLIIVLIITAFIVSNLFSQANKTVLSIKSLRNLVEKVVKEPQMLKDFLSDTNNVDYTDCIFLKRNDFFDNYKVHIDTAKFENYTIRTEEIRPLIKNCDLIFLEYSITIESTVTKEVCIFFFKFNYKEQNCKLTEIFLDYPYNLFHGDEH